MPFESRKNAILWLRAADLAAAAVCFLACLIVNALRSGDVSPDELLAVSFDLRALALLGGLLIVTAAVFSLFALYTETALFQWREALKATVKATTSVVLALLAGDALFHVGLATPLFLVCYWVLASVAGLTARFMVRRFLFVTEAQGIGARQTLVVGTNERAQQFATRILAHPELGYRLLGFVDDTWVEPPPAADVPGFRLVSDFAGFGDFLRNNVVDEVVVALPLKTLYDTASVLVAECEEQGVSVTIATRLFELKNPRRRPDRYGGDLVMTIANGLGEERELLIKRFMDITISAAALIVLSPLMLLTWAVIRLTSQGPALFVQERVGLNKRTFRFYKFRTMVQGAEDMQRDLETLNEMDGAIFKIKNDPRVTPVGRLLRKTSIDELPQLFNVLKGEMSLVGPRPLPVRDVQRIEKTWPRRRFSVKPGITCLWQVSGRNAMPFDRMMEMDIDYVDNWSLGLDLKLLLKTIPVVLCMRGAY